MTLNISAALAGASAAVLLTLGYLTADPRHIVEAAAVLMILFCVLMIQVVLRRDERKTQAAMTAHADGSPKTDGNS